MSRLQETANKWKDCPICEAHVRHLVEWDNEIDKLKAENEKLKESFDLKTRIHNEVNLDYIELRECVNETAKENEKLREALEFYADEENWCKEGICYEEKESFTHDTGYIARQSLKGKSE